MSLYHMIAPDSFITLKTNQIDEKVKYFKNAPVGYIYFSSNSLP